MNYKGHRPGGLTAGQAAAIAILALAAILIMTVYVSADITGDKPSDVARACLVEVEPT